MGYVLSFEAICKLAKELRKNNKIVYTHGAYDLFHFGHLEFLKRSKELGEILIVGLEPDKTISAYKGVKRPVFRLKERINIISKLDYVDFAFPLEYLPALTSKITNNDINQFHLNMYKIFRPDVVTFGKTYAGMRTINEAKTKLENIKFKRIIHKYSNMQSTTKIIDKIIGSASKN